MEEINHPPFVFILAHVELFSSPQGPHATIIIHYEDQMEYI